MGKLALALLVVVGFCAGLAAARSDRTAAARTVTVVIKNRDYHMIDLPPSGESIGDIRVGNAELWNRTEKRQLGTFHLFCALTERGSTSQITTCDFTFKLAGGEITTQGITRRVTLSTPAKADNEPIVGGTGAYAGARGVARLLPSKPDKRTVILRLLR